VSVATKSHHSTGAEKISPGGTFDSSPVRSAGLTVLIGDPSRTGRSIAACARGVACDQKPGVSIVPGRTDTSFCINLQHFVLGFYYQMSLRDQSSSHTPVLYWHAWAKATTQSLRCGRRTLVLKPTARAYESVATTSGLSSQGPSGRIVYFPSEDGRSATASSRRSRRCRLGTSHARQEACRPSLSHLVSSQRAVGYNFCLGWSV
jgi:hypothetical protein